MNRLIERQQTTIKIGDMEYPINTSYRNALMTWDAMEAVQTGDISILAATYASIKNMLSLDIEDIEYMSDEHINEALEAIAEYLNKYARISDIEHINNERSLLDIAQDSQLIYDAFQLMGIDLDTNNISYPRFMSLLRELPKEAAICRIIYLRQQYQRGKLTKEENLECQRRGWDIIIINDKSAEQGAIASIEDMYE